MKRYNLINNTLGWLCFFIAAATYLLTVEPTASFWDCPEFIAQGAKLEIGHPPGNPIFMLTARFFVTIFGGDITQAAIAVNSMSALLSAATILLLFWTITHLVKKIIVRDDATEISVAKTIVIMGAGLCGALAYTWSDTFWFSATEAEVYAFSSFCTALVFWLILKWENRADDLHSDRYLVLIAYVIGVSIAVHLLNLLCIPAIVLVFYYRKFKNTDAMGSLIALGISFVLVALILFGLVPGFVKVAQGFELFFVNVCGMSFNMGVLIYGIVLLAVFIYTINALYKAKKSDLGIRTGVFLVLMLSGLTFISDSVVVWIILAVAAAIYLFGICKEIPYRIFSVTVLSIFVIFIGYSSYALLLIRASADTPMNQNAPDNVFTLSSYLNREQYGKTPLIFGPVFAEQLDIQYVDAGNQTIGVVAVDEDGMPRVVPAETTLRDADGMAIDNGEYKYTKAVKDSPDQADSYVKKSYAPEYKNSDDVNMLFTRMYSTDPQHIEGYKSWAMYDNEDISTLRSRVPKNKLDEWSKQGYVLLYDLWPYLADLKPISTREGISEPDTYVWKPSMVDNLRYFINYQLNHMYWRYFMWNFAGRQNDLQGNGEPHLGNWISGIPFIDNARLGDQSLLPDEFGVGNPGHNVFYMLPLILGLLGIVWQSLLYHHNNPKRGIEQFWVVFFLFFMTGIAIVLYLNQTPGQPRERDYAFAGSFYAFAIWIGMGVPAIYWFIKTAFGAAKTKEVKAESKAEVADATADRTESTADRTESTADKADGTTDEEVAVPENKVGEMVGAIVGLIVGILVPLQMVSQTWDDHDRSNRYTARDFGKNYLNSLDANAIIFTNGDNDTFPLWYAQEVEGERTDVRVVNLSYLSTDWYANQQLNPYYDAAAVKMMATPQDYAYDRLSYSISRPDGKDSVPTSLQLLRDFYDSAPSKFGKMELKVLTTPVSQAPVDSVMACKAFGLNPNSVDSLTKMPYLVDAITMPGLRGGGFSLSKLLSYDIVANSINDGFERPVYFASSVPESYYLGLQPYLYTTGLTYQVAPFTGSEASPLVDKAYENIVSKFRWGGLDDPAHNKDLYLDETVRRMVATNRNAMVETAQDLVLNGELPATEFAIKWAKDNGLTVPQTRFDMARYMLNLMEEKLPYDVTLFDSSTELLTIQLYMQLYTLTGNISDLEHAEALIDQAFGRYAQLSRYIISLEPYQRENMGYLGQLGRLHLPLFIGYKNYLELYKALAKDPEANAEYLEKLRGLYDSDFRVLAYPYLYLTDMSKEEFENYAEYSEDFSNIATLAQLHEVAGVDRKAITNDVLGRYGLTIDELLRLNPYVHQ